LYYRYFYLFLIYSLSDLSDNLVICTSSSWSSRLCELILHLYGEKINLKPDNRQVSVSSTLTWVDGTENILPGCNINSETSQDIKYLINIHIYQDENLICLFK